MSLPPSRPPRRALLLALAAAFLLAARSGSLTIAQQPEARPFPAHRARAQQPGDAARGKVLFESKQAACAKCHALADDERRAGPNLSVIGDKFSREQLIDAVLEPNLLLHPDFGTVAVTTKDGRVITGVLGKRTAEQMELLDAESRLVQIALADVEAEQKLPTSLMPVDAAKALTPDEFADLIEFLASQRQSVEATHPGMPLEIPAVVRPIQLVPLHPETLRFDHPVWVIAVPGQQDHYLVVEQQTRKIWRLVDNAQGVRKELFGDLSSESITGQYEGVMCLDFHPRFRENRKYYVNYHVRENGRFSPVIAERIASDDLQHDAGLPSRRLLQIDQDTDLHWGGMLAFGPDGYLYIGAGDGGPQEDPDGNGQRLDRFLGSILRIDVDRRTGELPYGIPDSNPFRSAGSEVRPEIWATGVRMPWRFSFDPATGDFWEADIGQNLFEEVNIIRAGENMGWNVFEGFLEFSDRYRQDDVVYTPPVFSYRRREGVSVTGGYVYRGKRNPSYYGAYIFGDFESRKIWALTQQDRRLIKVRQIGESPEKIASFGQTADGELLLVGYEGTIYRVMLDESVFE